MNPITLVVMDDHPIVREGLIASLNREPDLRVLANGGQAALAVDLVGRFKPDVALLDIQMDESTFGLVNRVKEAHNNVKVLFISAFDTKSNAEQAQLLGGSGLISKQEGIGSIVTAIRRVAAGETVFSTSNEVSPDDAPKDHPLSPREIDVLRCVAHALTAKEIAKNLKISVKTVDRHKANIMHKLNMRSQSELVRYAIRKGFVAV